MATWNDLRESAERAGKRNLGWFFRQWVEGTGTPRLAATAQARPLADGRFETTVMLSQADRPFRLRLPVGIKTAGGTEAQRVWLDGATQEFRFETDAPPQAVVIDESYDVLRTLDDSERYPTLGQMENAREVILVLPRGDARPYRPVIERFKAEGRVLRLAFERPEFPRRGQRRAKGTRSAEEAALRRELMKEAGRVSAAELAARSFVVLGRDNPILARLFGSPPEALEEPAASLEVLAHPRHAAHFVAVIDSADERDSAALLDQTSDAAGYSQVRVAHGQVVDKRIAARARGWILPLGPVGVGAGS